MGHDKVSVFDNILNVDLFELWNFENSYLNIVDCEKRLLKSEVLWKIDFLKLIIEF